MAGRRNYAVTFNSKNIARNLVGSVLIPQVLEYSADDILKLQEPLDDAVSLFFSTLAEFMGTTTGLSGLGITGLAAWKPLSEPYRKRKHSDAFWIYTAVAGGNHKARLKMRASRLRKIAGRRSPKITLEPLIEKFEGIDGLEVFGGVSITADVETERLAETYFTDYMNLRNVSAGRAPVRALEGQTTDRLGRKLRTTRNESFQTRVDRLQEDSPDWEAVEAHFTVRLWSTLTQPEIANIEQTMVGQGILNQDDYNKLMNQAPNRRPLIRPYMAYYTNVLIPRIVQQVLNVRYRIAPGKEGNFSVLATTKGQGKAFFPSKRRAGVSLRSSSKHIGELISREIE